LFKGKNLCWNLCDAKVKQSLHTKVIIWFNKVCNKFKKGKTKKNPDKLVGSRNNTLNVDLRQHNSTYLLIIPQIVLAKRIIFFTFDAGNL